MLNIFKKSNQDFTNNISLTEILIFLDLGFSKYELLKIKEFSRNKNLKYRHLGQHEEKAVILSTLIRLEEGFSTSGNTISILGKWVATKSR